MNTAGILKKLAFDARIVSVWNGTVTGDSIARLEGEDEDYSYDCQVVKTGRRSMMAVTVLDGLGWRWTREYGFKLADGRLEFDVDFKREPDAPPWRVEEMNRKLDEAAEAFMKIFPPYPEGLVLE